MQDFLRVFFGEVGEVVLLDNLIHMCLVLCTGNAPQSSKDELQKSLSCWGEEYPRFVCPGEAKCGHRYVLVFRLSSDCKSCGRNKTDLRAARQNKCESSYSVSLFQGWQ